MADSTDEARDRDAEQGARAEPECRPPAAPTLPLPPGIAPAEPTAPTSPEAESAPSAVAAAPLALETDTGATFAVRLLGFAWDGDRAAERLGPLLGLDTRTAQTLIESVPAVVRRGASRSTAQALERALRELGAEVDIQPEGTEAAAPRSASVARARQAIALHNAAAGQAIAPPDLRAASAPSAAPRVSAAPRGEETAEALGSAHRGVGARLPIAFVVPLLGGGALWLASATAAALLGVVFVRVVPCVGWLELPLVGTLYLALLGSYFAQALRAGLEDSGDGWPRVRWELPPREELLQRGGPVLLLAAVLFAAPALGLLAGQSPVAVGAVFALALAYWPMALTTVGLTGSVGVGVHPLTVLAGVRAVGPPYLLVVAIGLVAAALLAAAGWVLLDAGPVGVAFAALLAACGVAYVHGVQGYLMGCLVASRFDDFEAVIR